MPFHHPRKIMFTVGCAAACAVMLASGAPAYSQTDFNSVEVRAEQVAPGVAVLFGAGGNIGVTFGPDGTVLIDDQFAPLTARIQAAIAALGATPVRFLINTHWHGDHSGGNENFGRAGALILAHDHVRERMAAEQRRGERVTPPSPAAALPVLTWHDGVNLHLNGGEISAIHAPHAHTDGDSIIWFRTANVVHMGDLYFNRMSLPFIDLDSGGDVRGVLAAVERVLAMTNDATVIIPGHGPIASRADLMGYRDMLTEVITAVTRERAAGKTLEQIVALQLAARWDVNPTGFIRGDAFVTAVWQSLENGAYARHAAMHGGGHAEPAPAATAAPATPPAAEAHDHAH